MLIFSKAQGLPTSVGWPNKYHIIHKTFRWCSLHVILKCEWDVELVSNSLKIRTEYKSELGLYFGHSNTSTHHFCNNDLIILISVVNGQTIMSETILPVNPKTLLLHHTTFEIRYEKGTEARTVNKEYGNFCQPAKFWTFSELVELSWVELSWALWARRKLLITSCDPVCRTDQ